MFKVTLYKSMNVRSGEVPLRFRLREDKDVDLALETGIKVAAVDLQAFGSDGAVRPGLKEYNLELKKEIDRYCSLMSEVYLELKQSGAAFDDESFQKAVEEKMAIASGEVQDTNSLVERFRQYLYEEHEVGRFSDRMLRESLSLSRKLERYLVIREKVGLKPADFTLEMVTDFEKFCIDEYLYASNPKYAELYPRSYAECRYWPKRRLNEEAFRKVLIHFHTFWNDLVLFGEIEKSPYEGYVPWMEEKPQKWYSEMNGEPMTLTMDEFQQVLVTPVPERMANVRNAFIFQVCTGCRGEDLFKLKMKNLHVSKQGIPYIKYSHSAIRKKEKIEYGYDIEVPLVRIAFDIALRTRLEFHFGRRPDPYNQRIHEFLRFCGITREVNVLNHRNEETESVPLCDAFTQLHIHHCHMDIVHESECLRGMRGDSFTGARVMEKRKKQNIEDQFWNLNWAFAQKTFRVDENLNIVEGLPFVERDPLVYQEQPDKLLRGRTNPYVISELLPMSSGEGKTQDRVAVRNGCALLKPRKVVVCGDQFLPFLDSLEEEHRRCIQYGILLLKMLSDFKVTFVEDWKDTIYELKSAPRGFKYSTYFYVNGDTIVLLHGCLDEKHRRHKASGNVKMDVVRALRWKHVTGELSGVDYDGVLDGIFGARGSTKREVWEMRACCGYVSQSLRQARIDSGLMQEELFAKWGLKDDCGNLAHAENGNRVLPYKYLYRHLDGLGLKAVLVRPGLIDWNVISRSHTLEQMLEDIGEPVYRWKRKEVVE